MTNESQNLEYKREWKDEYLKVLCAETLPNKITQKLGIVAEIQTQLLDKIEVLEISVKASMSAISFDGRYYVRSGSSTFLLEGNELTQFLLKKHGQSWDEMIDEGANLSDIDENSISKFKQLAIDRLPSIQAESNLELILKKLNLMRGNKLTRAAILLFGKDPQRFYLQARIRIGKFVDPIEVLTTDIVEGNLFFQIESAIDILRTKYLLSPIHYEGLYRKDVLEYPKEALREAIINALIHREYATTSNIQIRVQPNDLLIMNEGKLPPEISPQDLKGAHVSVPKNFLLAEVFFTIYI